MSNNLFIINNEINLDNYGIYIDLEIAKNELIKIYENTINYNYYNYKIMVYVLDKNEYIFTNQKYTYIFDKFIEY